MLETVIKAEVLIFSTPHPHYHVLKEREFLTSSAGEPANGATMVKLPSKDRPPSCNIPPRNVIQTVKV